MYVLLTHTTTTTTATTSITTKLEILILTAVVILPSRIRIIAQSWSFGHSCCFVACDSLIRTLLYSSVLRLTAFSLSLSLSLSLERHVYLAMVCIVSIGFVFQMSGMHRFYRGVPPKGICHFFINNGTHNPLLLHPCQHQKITFSDLRVHVHVHPSKIFHRNNLPENSHASCSSSNA